MHDPFGVGEYREEPPLEIILSRQIKNDSWYDSTTLGIIVQNNKQKEKEERKGKTE